MDSESLWFRKSRNTLRTSDTLPSTSACSDDPVIPTIAPDPALESESAVLVPCAFTTRSPRVVMLPALPTEALVRDAMEGAAELRVPLVVDVGYGANWADAK